MIIFQLFKTLRTHDDVIKWKHFPRYWPFVRGIHRWPVNSPHKGQWRRDLMFSLIYAWTNGWINTRDAGDLRRHHAHYGVTVMRTKWSRLQMSWNDMESMRGYYANYLKWDDISELVFIGYAYLHLCAPVWVRNKRKWCSVSFIVLHRTTKLVDMNTNKQQQNWDVENPPPIFILT